MEKNFEKFNFIKNNQIILLENEFKNVVNKAQNKVYAENKFIESLNSKYQKKQSDFVNYARFLIEIEEKKELDKFLDEEKEFDKFNSTEISNLANLASIKYFLNEFYSKETDEIQIPNTKSSIIWKGKNQTEFVQMIYGLYHSGILTNNENEKTKLVKQIAAYFNLPLSENWQSNLSKAANKRNYDYEPQIIKKIKSGYEIFQNQINAKKNKSK